MKVAAIFAAGLLAGSFAGCVQSPVSATLEHVVAPSVRPEVELEQGCLIVFSAYEVGLVSPSEIENDPEHHSDYDVRDEGGRLVAKVKNRDGPFGSAPARVNLPPGTYQVTARANGCGRITLPVTIATNRVTALHLEGETAPAGRSTPAEYDLVRIPDGRVVGWCVTTARGVIR